MRTGYHNFFIKIVKQKKKNINTDRKNLGRLSTQKDEMVTEFRNLERMNIK